MGVHPQYTHTCTVRVHSTSLPASTIDYHMHKSPQRPTVYIAEATVPSHTDDKTMIVVNCRYGDTGLPLRGMGGGTK